MIGRAVSAGEDCIQVITFRIPRDVITIDSEIIKVTYYLHCTADIPRETDIYVDLPITITAEPNSSQNE